MNKFSENTNMVEIPDNAFVFNMAGECSFIDGDGDDKGNNIRLTLYDGSIVNHWYWGNLAFELKTMKLAKKRIPILEDHETNKRIGFSTDFVVDKKAVLLGKFLDSEDANAVKKDAAGGFPFEASLRFNPSKSKIEHIKEDATVEVNGKTLKGPGTLIRNAVIMEGSTCTFGALNNCVTESFKEIKPMADEAKLTVDSFATQYPDIFKSVCDTAKAEGQKLEQERFAAFNDKFGDDPEFLVEQFAKGAKMVEAVEAQNAKLKEQLKNNAANSEAADADKVDPAEQEFSDQQTDKDKDKGDKPKTFMEAANKYAAEHKCSLAAAVSKCVDIYPELHANMPVATDD